MSEIVRAEWSPAHPHFGSYGVLGPPHPTLPAYRWVEWIDSDGRQRSFRGGEPAEGYYRAQYLVRVGTAVFA